MGGVGMPAACTAVLAPHHVSTLASMLPPPPAPPPPPPPQERLARGKRREVQSVYSRRKQAASWLALPELQHMTSLVRGVHTGLRDGRGSGLHARMTPLMTIECRLVELGRARGELRAPSLILSSLFPPCPGSALAPPQPLLSPGPVARPRQVRTRSFAQLLGRRRLVPALDMLNHSEEPNTRVAGKLCVPGRSPR